MYTKEIIGEIKAHTGQYLKLPDFYTKYGYQFKLFKRVEDVAIYEQIDEGKVIAYEVFEVIKNDAWEAFGKKFDAKEAVPGTNEWGKNAYTVFTIERAEERMKEILENNGKNKINM